MFLRATPFVSAVDELFESLVGLTPRMSGTAITATAHPTHSDLQIPVPGYAPDQVEVAVAGRRLTIALARGEERAVRSFALPAWVDGETIEAAVANGMLTIRLPRAASAQPRQIPVGTALPALGAGDQAVS
jgi:HSP20 family protein